MSEPTENSGGPRAEPPARVNVEGGAGIVVGFDGKLLHLWLSRPFAPGAPIRATVEDGQGVFTLEGRAIGSKRARLPDRHTWLAPSTTSPSQESPSEGFDVRLRLINASRELRRRLEAIASSP